jgi:hypothetical protein
MGKPFTDYYIGDEAMSVEEFQREFGTLSDYSVA